MSSQRSICSPTMSDTTRARLLLRLGHEANASEDLILAREAFLTVVRLTGRVEARVSAANMLCKIAQAESAADIGTAGYHAEAAQREYEVVLASTQKAAVRDLCQQRQTELSALLSTLDARASAQARTAAMSEPPKRKRGAVTKLEEGVCELLSPPPPLPAGQPRPSEVLINRSPVRVLWAAVNAHRLGLSWPEALSLGSALAGMVARAKGRALGIHPGDDLADQAALSQNSFGLMGQRVPVVDTEGGLRGLSVAKRGGAGSSNGADAPLQPVLPAAAFRSLAAAFGPNFGEVYHWMAALAASIPVHRLREEDNALANRLYCAFRPQIPEGRMGWGQAGRLLLTGGTLHASLSSPVHGRGGGAGAAGRLPPSESLEGLAMAEWDAACRRLQVGGETRPRGGVRVGQGCGGGAGSRARRCFARGAPAEGTGEGGPRRLACGSDKGGTPATANPPRRASLSSPKRRHHISFCGSALPHESKNPPLLQILPQLPPQRRSNPIGQCSNSFAKHHPSPTNKPPDQQAQSSLQALSLFRQRAGHPKPPCPTRAPIAPCR